MICMSRRRRRSWPRLAAVTSISSKTHAAGGRLDQAQDEASERALAGAGFADEAEGFAGFNVERNVVNGTHLALGSSAKYGLAQRKHLYEIADRNQRHDTQYTKNLVIW